MATETKFVVLKFGGTSVTGADRWRTIHQQLQARVEEGLLPVIVCSALSGVTNQLEALIAATTTGEHEPLLEGLKERHLQFAEELGVDGHQIVGAFLDDLSKLALGASLVGEVSPRVKARILSAGELCSTKLGAAWLEAQGLKVAWQDARDSLITVELPIGDEDSAQSYLSARCRDDIDEALKEKWAGLGAQAIVTQGFIASRPDGDTAVLGRGGSDTSAAYFAARLGAVRCEIWTDVPGVYTADPRDVPTSRLLLRLDYDEAQEIATCGAKVLHPRCLLPARRADIPVEIRCTPLPEQEGTRIARVERAAGARVKAVSAKRGVTLVSMSTLGMWQQVGFLADMFGLFKKHGVSVDLVSTSESNVTASIDESQPLDDDALDNLIEDLNQFCKATLIRACAAVSLVGRDIRTILHRLGPALELFEEHRIHLVSQAASDLNLTFVVDESQAERLVRRLHALFFGAESAHDPLLGPTYADTFGKEGEGEPDHAPAALPWWRERKAELLELAAEGTPRYVYDAAQVRRAAESLTGLEAVDRVFFAMKANSHEGVLRTLHDAGVGFECVSVGELDRIRALFPDLDPGRILFTPNFAPPAEYEEAFSRGVRVNVDNVEVFEQAPDVFRGQRVLLRLDPGQGKGHHAHVRTAGPQSKFGIAPDQLDALADKTEALGVTVVGLHAHAGSGIRSPDTWRQTALFLLSARERFGAVQALDLGGGLGVVERPGQRPLDVEELGRGLAEVKAAHPDVELWLEPGRYLVSTAGVLLATVTQTKRKSEVQYVGIDAGMHTLIRPALYGAFHDIVNLSRLDETPAWVANVVGPICETGDTLGYARSLPESQPGDVLLVATAGAYGRVMASDYNLRGRPEETMLR